MCVPMLDSITALAYLDTWREEKQRETKEDLDGQCQGRPKGEKHRLDRDFQDDQKHRGLEKSCKTLIVSLLMEERKEEEYCSHAAHRF